MSDRSSPTKKDMIFISHNTEGATETKKHQSSVKWVFVGYTDVLHMVSWDWTKWCPMCWTKSRDLKVKGDLWQHVVIFSSFGNRPLNGYHIGYLQQTVHPIDPEKKFCNMV